MFAKVGVFEASLLLRDKTAILILTLSAVFENVCHVCDVNDDSCFENVLNLNAENGISIFDEISLGWNLNRMNCLKKKTCLLNINKLL